MSFTDRWKTFKMLLGTIYQRILVAAGAVALLVVNWFCKPIRRSPPPPQQGTATEGALQEALLQAQDDAEEDSSEPESGYEKAASYAAPGLSPPGMETQLDAKTPSVTADDVVMEASDPSDSDLLLPAEPSKQASTSSATATSELPAAAAVSPIPELSKTGEPAAAQPIDDDYLKSFHEQQLGPPKFTVQKPVPAEEQKPKPQAPGVDPALQALLAESFGPPRFSVPKQGSPAPAPAPATKPAPTAYPHAAAAAPNTDASAEQPAAAESAGASCATLAPPVSSSPAAGRKAGSSAGTGVGIKRSLQEDVGVDSTGTLGPPGSGAAVAAGGNEFQMLALSVTQGPAAGKVLVADDPSVEYKIGRLPDCALQILDQEISGRHASVRWDNIDRRWKLHDVGSLNGTLLGGQAIGRDYKVPGEEHPLVDGDSLMLGSVTTVRVGLATPVAGSGLEFGATSAKRHHSAAQDTGLEPSVGSSNSSGGIPDRIHAETVSGFPGMQGLPTPAVLTDCPALGVRLCVHNKLGADHKRMSQGCEDVPYWELPYEPYAGAGLVCVFDGHHGSKAAKQARQHLPAILRARLLLRDGRQPPPLPPPPPPPPKTRPGDEDGEEEEQLDEGYNGEEEAEGGDEEAVEGGEVMTAEGGSEGDQGSEQAEEGGRRKVGGGAGGEGGEPEAAGKGVRQQSVATEAEEGADGAETRPGQEEEQQQQHKEEGASPAPELLPPPPAGPPLPLLLRDRDLASQQALLKDAFLTADQYMSMEEGCTATVVMVEADPQGAGWLLQSANVGDSSAVLVNFTRGTWCKLSEDHRIASSVSERQRLAARGHSVRTRLYGLNISRMLGDRFLKEEDLGFLAEPYVGPVVQVEAGDSAVLVVASDGLWDVLPEERAAKMLLQEASKAPGSTSLIRTSFGSRPQPSPPPPAAADAAASLSGSGMGCQAVADLLLAQALMFRSKDDITISVMEMGPHLRGGGGGA